MLPIFCHAYDRSLVRLFSFFVKPKRGQAPPDARFVPASPADLADVAPLAPRFEADKADKDGGLKFEVESPVESAWPESQMLRGRALGPADARAAIIVLHGACDNEYTYSRWMGQSFLKHGFRAIVPAAPCHLDRAPKGSLPGSPMFWSAPAVVAGMAQWLVEIRGLMGYLRGEGVQTIGLIGYSIGSLTAGIAATLWSDLDFACFLAPVGHHLRALETSRVARTLWPWMAELPAEETALLDRWSALHRPPVAGRPLFLMTEFDLLQPYPLQQDWWQTWNRPESHRYRHGHMSILFCKQLYRDLEAFAAEFAAK